MNAKPIFDRYIGIDYSGAQTATSGLKGLRVYSASVKEEPVEILPPVASPRYWTRRGLAEWLIAELREGPSTLVGIDHAFSFPLRYFEVHRLEHDWAGFLDDFQNHWPTDGDFIYIDFIRDGLHGNGSSRSGNARWRRMTEERCRAKSVFHFDVPGSVAKSTHAGLPWLRRIREQLGARVHFWPFDGWTPPSGASAIAEAYPSLWSKSFPQEDRNPDQHDAYSTARWMKETDAVGALHHYFHPASIGGGNWTGQIEGWILGVD